MPIPGVVSGAHTRTSPIGSVTSYSLTVHVTGDPLGAAYRDSDRRLGTGEWAWPLFEPGTVRGLPAVVRANLNPDRYCDVVVGFGQGQGITVTGSPGVPAPDLCDRLVAAAERLDLA